jgi:hypothetical protein
MRQILLRFFRLWRRARVGMRSERPFTVPTENAPRDTNTARSPQQTDATHGRWIGNLLPPP